MATSILGADDAALGNLVLGVVPIEELLIAATSGLVALYKCDVAVGAGTLPDAIGGFNASVTGTGNAITQYGVDDLALTLPNATPAASPPPYTKDTTPHSHYKYSGNGIPIGTTGTIMLWFTPTEFGDEHRVPGGMIPPTPQTYYDIVRLSNDSTGLAVAIRAFQTNPDPGPYAFALNWNADSGHTGDANFSYYGLVSGFNLFDPSHIAATPSIGPNQQFFLVLTWDSSGIFGYINGQKCFDGNYFELDPPADLGSACNFKIGDCGGAYDLVSLFNRKMTQAEIVTLYNAALNTVQQNVVITQLYANYASTYLRNLRVTNERNEVLRTGLRNLRITKQFVEVLRSVSHDSHHVTQTLVMTQSATGYVSHDITQTLTFNQTVHVEIGVHSVVQRLDFTETVSLAGSVFNRAVYDILNLTQSIHAGGVHSASVVQLLTFTETTVGKASHDVNQTLHFIETVIGTVHHLHDEQLTQTVSQNLTFQQTAWINGPYGLYPVSGQLDYPLGDIDLSGEGGLTYLTDRLIFDETVTTSTIHNIHVTDHLVFTETLSRQMFYHRTINDQLIFLDGYNKALDLYIGGQQVQIPIPTVYVSIVGHSTRIVVIRSKNGVIVLPTPEWGDTEDSGNVVNVKRSMTGKVYTYVKTAQWHKLHYDFTITRKKALEFQAFLIDNLSEVLTLENWKGQQYLGQITQNPTSLVGAGRYAKSYEKVTVAFEFEGVKVHG